MYTRQLSEYCWFLSSPRGTYHFSPLLCGHHHFRSGTTTFEVHHFWKKWHHFQSGTTSGSGGTFEKVPPFFESGTTFESGGTFKSKVVPLSLWKCYHFRKWCHFWAQISKRLRILLKSSQGMLHFWSCSFRVSIVCQALFQLNHAFFLCFKLTACALLALHARERTLWAWNTRKTRDWAETIETRKEQL